MQTTALMVTPQDTAMTAYKNILAAVDTSPEAKPVIERARELSEHYGAQLYLIHVVEPIITMEDYELMPALPLETEEIMVQRSKGYLSALAAELQISAARQTVAVGAVKHEILRHAQQHDCDLIVVGAHGRHGIATLLGSTANAVLHGTRCDLLCVRVD